MIQKKIFEAIKLHLEKVYGLNMLSLDVRFAYVIYYAYMQDFHDIVNPKMIIEGAYKEFIDKSITYGAFLRAVYRTLKKMFDDKETKDYARQILNIVKQIEL